MHPDPPTPLGFPRASTRQAPSISEVTTIEYNRWLVENGAKQGAEERKQTHDEERKLRQAMQDKYRSVGSQRAKELKEQMSTAKAEVEAYHDDNKKKGGEVKEEVNELRRARKKQTDAWLEHGSQLSREYGSEQKQRIKSQIGAMSTRKTADSKAMRAQCKKEEDERAERRGRELADAQKQAADTKAATSDAVTRAAKQSFFEQRKGVGDDTRVDMTKWKQSRGAQKEAYAAKAAAAKQEALQIKKAAKEALMAHSAAKAKAAKEMRDKKNALETNYAKVKGDLGTVKKQVHDMTRTRKYVSSDAAETMRQKKTSPKPSGSA